MNRMNPVDTGMRHPIDGGTDRHHMSALIIIAAAAAIFLGAGMIFYSWFSSPSTTLTTDYSPIVDNFRSLEASRPGPASPTTVGQGGDHMAN
jgi:hypothetical protein